MFANIFRFSVNKLRDVAGYFLLRKNQSPLQNPIYQ